MHAWSESPYSPLSVVLRNVAGVCLFPVCLRFRLRVVHDGIFSRGHWLLSVASRATALKYFRAYNRLDTFRLPHRGPTNSLALEAELSFSGLSTDV